MDKEKLEVVRVNYNDLRFGPVDVMNDLENNNLIMIKKEKFNSIEKFKLQVKQIKKRYSFKNKNIHKVLGIKIDEDELETEIYYIYPNDDLFERIEDFRNPNEMLKFLKDIIQAIYFLQKKNLIHGNLRPEYISYDHEINNYQILDRLVNKNSPEKTQMENINKKECIYLCPLFFSYLMKTSKKKQNLFKSEIFSVGLIFLSVVYNEDDIQNLYDFESGVFDKVKFHNLMKFLDERVFIEEKPRKIFKFIENNMLSYEEIERKMPYELLMEIKKEFGLEFDTYEEEENNRLGASILLNSETFISYYPVNPKKYEEINLFVNDDKNDEKKKELKENEKADFDVNQETMNIENYIQKDDLEEKNFFEEDLNKNLDKEDNLVKEEMSFVDLTNIKKLCQKNIEDLFFKVQNDLIIENEELKKTENEKLKKTENEVLKKNENEVLKKTENVLKEEEIKKFKNKIEKNNEEVSNLQMEQNLKNKICNEKENQKFKENSKEKKTKKKKKEKLFNISNMYNKVAKNLKYGFYEEKKNLEIKKDIPEVYEEKNPIERKNDNTEIVKEKINFENFTNNNEIKIVQSTPFNLINKSTENKLLNDKNKYKVCDIYNFKQEFPDDKKEFLKIKLEINNNGDKIVTLDENVENRRKKTVDKRRKEKKDSSNSKIFHNMGVNTEVKKNTKQKVIESKINIENFKNPQVKVSKNIFKLNNSGIEVKNTSNLENFNQKTNFQKKPVKVKNSYNIPINNNSEKKYINNKEKIKKKNTFGIRNKSPIRIKRITREQFEKSKGNKNVRSISPIISKNAYRSSKISYVERIKKKGGTIIKNIERRKSVVRAKNPKSNLEIPKNGTEKKKNVIIYKRDSVNKRNTSSNRNFYNDKFEIKNKERNIKICNSIIVNDNLEKLKEFNDQDVNVDLNELQHLAIKSGKNIYLKKR